MKISLLLLPGLFLTAAATAATTTIIILLRKNWNIDCCYQTPATPTITDMGILQNSGRRNAKIACEK